MKVYGGVDFANAAPHFSTCWLVDDGSTLDATFSQPPQAADRIGIDCPLGTTDAFVRLLRGLTVTDRTDPTFKNRKTEVWVRKTVGAYQSLAHWKDLLARSKWKDYFITSWIRPTLDVVMVPAVLELLTAHCSTQKQRLAKLRSARLGDDTYLEAYPLPFLRSVVERVLRSGYCLGIAEMNAVRRYKHMGKARWRVIRLLQTQQAWMGNSPRSLSFLPQDLDRLTQGTHADHAFDAWLCALTAWAHEHGETATWRDAKLKKRIVEVEGHILILKL